MVVDLPPVLARGGAAGLAVALPVVARPAAVARARARECMRQLPRVVAGEGVEGVGGAQGARDGGAERVPHVQCVALHTRAACGAGA